MGLCTDLDGMDFDGIGLIEPIGLSEVADRWFDWFHKPAFCCGVAFLVFVGIVVGYQELRLNREAVCSFLASGALAS